MLILLIIYISKKLKGSLKNFTGIGMKLLFIVPRMIFVLILFSSMKPPEGTSSIDHLKFEIIYKKESIGFVDVIKEKKGDTTLFSLKAQVEYRGLVKYKILSSETSVYNNDVLLHSSIFLQVNQKVKVNQKLSLNNGIYELSEEENSLQIQMDEIRVNLNKLFFYEPKNIVDVYCDKMKLKLPIVKIGECKYKISFSGLKSNIYHYENGICSMLEARSPLFKVKLVAVNI